MVNVPRRYGESPMAHMARWSAAMDKRDAEDAKARNYAVNGYKRCGDKWVKRWPQPKPVASYFAPPVTIPRKTFDLEKYNKELAAEIAREILIDPNFVWVQTSPPPSTIPEPPPLFAPWLAKLGRKAWQRLKTVPWWGALFWFTAGLAATEITRALRPLLF